MTRFNLVCLVLLICVSGLFLYLMYDEPPPSDDATDLHSYIPDYSANVLHSVQFDRNGRPSSKVWAEDMQHFEQLGLTQFGKPVLLVYPKNDNPAWQVSAQEGLLMGRDKATLQQNVVISSQSDENQLNTLHTSYLEIDLVEQNLHTDRPVRLVGPNYILKGIGMRANAESEHIDILDKIQAVYEPN